MSERELSEALVGVFVQVFDLRKEDVHPAMTPDDVAQWDSLAHVRLVSAIEQTFHCQLDIDDVMALTSFGAILEVVVKRTRVLA